ncbi:MAG: hypothetical protein KC561_05000, partial [Myxococcales bacterium]|nr:hypothetical protein [Myxococcales bacterium]
MERIREVHEGADLPVSGARTRGGLWSESFYDYPQMLAAAGARYDASYGTAEVHRQQSFPGYLHGTGRPFELLGENGLPLGLLEFPVLFPNLPGADGLEGVERIMRRSERSHHQVISVQFSSGMFAEPDPLGRFDAWLQVMDMATRRGHQVLSHESYQAFRRARTDVRMRSELSAEEDGPNTTLVVNLEPIGEQLTLRVPAELNGDDFRAARLRTGENTSDLETRTTHVFGIEQVLVNPPESGGRIEVVYR